MSVSVLQYKNFVGGEWVDASSGEAMEVLNPATGEVIAEVPRSTAEDVGRAVVAGVTANRLHILPNPEWQAEVDAGHDGVVADFAFFRERNGW